MERVSFRRADVRAWLSGMVCMKINAGNGSALADKFGVRGFPTIVLIEPGGKILYKDAGAPAPDRFSGLFAYKSSKAAADAFNSQDWKKCATNTFFVRKWFKGTESGNWADDLHKKASVQTAYTEAYAAAKAAYDKKLEAARAVIRAEEKVRAEARKMMDEAAAHMKKFKRYTAYSVYKKVILKYPDTPEADEARAILRKAKKKWKEPKR